MSSFNQGVPGPATLINSSNCIVYGNTSSGTALTVQQLGAGAVMNVATSTGSSALFVSSTGQVGIGTGSPTSQLHVYSLTGVQNQTGQGVAQIVNCGGLPLNINYTGIGGALNYAIYSVSGSSTVSTVNKLFRYIGSVLSDGSSGNLGGLHVEGIIGGGAGGNACYLKADFTNRGIVGGYKYSQLTGGTVDSTMNIFMVSNTSSTNYDLYIQYGNSQYNGFNLDIKSTWNTFNFINIEGTADPRTAPTSYATSWDLLGTANFVQKGSNGNVGIGTTNPGYPLDVLSSSTTSLFRIQSSNDPATMVISTYSDTTKDCAIRNNNGQLGFTASSTPGTPYIKFFTGASGAFTNLLGGFSSTLTGGATTLSVDASGYIIRTPSDERLKTDVQPISYGLDTVNSFRPVSYNWNEPDKYGSGRSIGLIAQEVGELVPEAVSAGGDEDKILSLDYQKLVPVLTKAIQELSQENTALKQSLETATAQLQSIEQRLAALEGTIGSRVGA